MSKQNEKILSIIIIFSSFKKMETRAGTDIQEEARNDRIKFKLKLREKMLTEKLKRRIVPPSPQTAQNALSKAS